MTHISFDTYSFSSKMNKKATSVHKGSVILVAELTTTYGNVTEKKQTEFSN